MLPQGEQTSGHGFFFRKLTQRVMGTKVPGAPDELPDDRGNLPRWCTWIKDAGKRVGLRCREVSIRHRSDDGTRYSSGHSSRALSVC